MPPPYRLLLFDLDGTLVDTVADITYYVNEVLVERGLAPVSVPQVKEAIGWGVHELLRILAPVFSADPEGLEVATQAFKDRYRLRPVLETRPFPGVVEVLEGPLKNTAKAIVTNKPQDIALRVLEKLGIKRHFEHVIGTLGDFPPKPDPASSLYLMRRFGTAPESTVYIGDSGVDAETSAAAGIDFGWVEYGYQSSGGFTPRFRFSNAAEWERLVR